jgi:hypothetical protein
LAYRNDQQQYPMPDPSRQQEHPICWQPAANVGSQPRPPYPVGLEQPPPVVDAVLVPSMTQTPVWPQM